MMCKIIVGNNKLEDNRQTHVFSCQCTFSSLASIVASTNNIDSTTGALDNAVLNNEKAIAMFPDLIESHSSQCKTIVKYGHFKTFLKNNFK